MGSGQHLVPRDRRERGVVGGEEWRYPGRVGRKVAVERRATGIGGAFLLVSLVDDPAVTFGLRYEDFVRG